MTNQVEQIIWLIALHQMDMVEEAANLTRFRHNFRNTEEIIFPEPILCKRYELNSYRRCRSVMNQMGPVSGAT